MAVILSAATACSSFDPCREPFYAGKATDEAWQSMVDAERLVMVDDPKAPDVTTPGSGATFAAGDPAPVFRWTSSLRASSFRMGPTVLVRRPGAGRPRRSLWKALEGLFAGEAWAHLPPVTGDIYYLQLQISGSACRLSALTTELEWTVAPRAWEILKAAAGQSVTLQITSAYLRDNRITEGPFRPSQPRTFTMSP